VAPPRPKPQVQSGFQKPPSTTSQATGSTKGRTGNPKGGDFKGGKKGGAAKPKRWNQQHGQRGIKIPQEVLDLIPHDETNYNPADFNCKPTNARCFVIKSYSEEDVHKSIKFNVWTSTEHGNKRLDRAYKETRGPV